jgi:hypothetical protein
MMNLEFLKVLATSHMYKDADSSLPLRFHSDIRPVISD